MSHTPIHCSTASLNIGSALLCSAPLCWSPLGRFFSQGGACRGGGGERVRRTEKAAEIIHPAYCRCEGLTPRFVPRVKKRFGSCQPGCQCLSKRERRTKPVPPSDSDYSDGHPVLVCAACWRRNSAKRVVFFPNASDRACRARSPAVSHPSAGGRSSRSSRWPSRERRRNPSSRRAFSPTAPKTRAAGPSCSRGRCGAMRGSAGGCGVSRGGPSADVFFKVR